MEFTDFAKLQFSIKRMGIDTFERDLLEKLELGTLEGDTKNTENIILGELGIYHLEKGVLAKVILHITDIGKMWIEKKPTAIEHFNQKNYHHPEFIKALHKYHFTKCTTLNDMFRNNRKKRYYKAQRTDGKFKYAVIDNNQTVYESGEQELYVCQYCLGVLRNLTEENYAVENFKPNDVFDTNMNPPTIPNTFDLECNAVPNIYQADWREIATQAKRQANWKCEKCGGDFEENRKFLHCHHVDSMRTNNRSSNLKVLCIRCHANEPNHRHLTNTPTYKEYEERYDAN